MFPPGRAGRNHLVAALDRVIDLREDVGALFFAKDG
jgi:hypothetical protein